MRIGLIDVDEEKKMRIIVKGKGEGKTTELIKMSVETNTYILVLNRKRQHEVARMARDLGYKNMPFPVTIEEHFRAHRSTGMINRRFLIDDADDILHALIGRDIPILAITMTESEDK